MSPVERHAAPRNIHRRRIRNANDADCSRLSQRFPALSRGLIVGGQSRGNIRWRAAQQDRNFPLEIEPIEVVIVLLRDFQPVSHKDQRGLHFVRAEIDASAEVSVFTQAEWLFRAIPDERSRRILFDDLSGNELYRLVIATRARRLKSSFGQL